LYKQELLGRLEMGDDAMRFLALGLAALMLSTTASAQVYVHGYTKKDGTYVAPHYRSSPNGTKLDNYSTKGNVNPYTGKVGTKDPYGSSQNSNGAYGSYSNPYSSSSDQNSNSSTTCYYPPC
jgi:hypothetical protein